MTDLTLLALWLALALAVLGALRLDLLQLLWRESLRLFGSGETLPPPDDHAAPLPERPAPAAHAAPVSHRPAFHRRGRRA